MTNVVNDAVRTLNIDLGSIRLAVDGDMSRIISFNPNDIGFAERFYSLISKIDKYQKKYTEKAEELDKNPVVDEFGIRKNQKEVFSLCREMCEELRSDVDDIFGKGTSDKVFGSINTLEMFSVFFSAITPYVQKSRNKKMDKYRKAAKAITK